MNVEELTLDTLAAFPMPATDPEVDKDSRGRVLLIGGSALSPGAMLLSGVAALRAGAGKLLVATADAAARATGLFAPEFGVAGLRATDAGEPAADDECLDPHLDHCDAAILGPGMVDEHNARRMAVKILARLKVPVILDAAAITGFSNRFEALQLSKARRILTPHAGEMAKLMGVKKDQVRNSPLEFARRAAGELDSIIVLKGASTFVAAPSGAVWRHSGGVSGLATAGSGDTLAGLIGALVARGLSPDGAALWGVLVHAKAGANLSRSVGTVGFLARELPDEFPAILHLLSGATRTS